MLTWTRGRHHEVDLIRPQYVNPKRKKTPRTHLHYDNVICASCGVNVMAKSRQHNCVFTDGRGKQSAPTRYSKLRVVHAPGNAENVSPPPTSKETAFKRTRHASRHVRHARAVMHVGIANPRWRGKRSRHSRRMRSPQFDVSGKRPMPRGFPCHVDLTP